VPGTATVLSERCLGALVVYCPRPAIARRYRGMFEGEGLSLSLRPFIFTAHDARGVPVPDAVREQILACTDLTQLDTWLRRVATAATADDVVRP
jgi:hypothetical protein